MTRKNFIIRLIAVVLTLSAIMSTASATTPEANNADNENLKTVYVTWEFPIPPSEKGDKLNMSVGVLVNDKTYVTSDVLNVLGISQLPKSEGLAITVENVTEMYYPLRKNAEQNGYSVLWAPKSEQDGKVLDYWVYIAQKQDGNEWVQVVEHEVAEDNYKCYQYRYAYFADNQYCYLNYEGETCFIPNEDATIVE